MRRELPPYHYANTSIRVPESYRKGHYLPIPCVQCMLVYSSIIVSACLNSVLVYSSILLYTTTHWCCRFSTERNRHNYVTPTSYLELISSFKTLLGKKRGEIVKTKKRYEVGLEKLAFAASQVSRRGGRRGWYSTVLLLL